MKKSAVLVFLVAGAIGLLSQVPVLPVPVTCVPGTCPAPVPVVPTPTPTPIPTPGPAPAPPPAASTIVISQVAATASNALPVGASVCIVTNDVSQPATLDYICWH